VECIMEWEDTYGLNLQPLPTWHTLLPEGS
jgi:hypothetical protein